MKNRFDEKYDIRLAQYDEIPELMSFIDTFWKKGHILGTNREFFEYEMIVDGQVNFMIAKEKETKRIEGLLGFLPCSRQLDKLDVWGVIWKTIPNAMPLLGIELKKRLVLAMNVRNELGVGANSKTSVPLLSRILHYYTAQMKHYYRLADIDDYKIANIKEKIIPQYNNDRSASVFELKSWHELEEFYDFESSSDTIPYKDFWYYKKRFYEHPIYKYNVWAIFDGKEKAFLVTKRQECNDSSAIRIVDYRGEEYLFALCGPFFDELLQDSEYIDFYFDGFDASYVKKAGLHEVEEDINIIPDYFSPYEQKNVDIYVVSSNQNDKCTFFKADGDQDRPN